MTAAPNYKLQELVPLNELSDIQVKKIANASYTEHILPARQLLANEEHRWLVYLLDGKLSVDSSDGLSHTLESNSVVARTPLFDSTKRSVKASALQPCHIVRIEKAMVQVLLQEEQNASTVVHEIETDKAGEELFTRVYQAYVDRKLELPSLPDAALKIREVIRNPDLGIADVARVVQTDPALTARLIQVSNSPIYQGIGPVESALAAVNRLGGSTTQNLAFVMAVSNLFQSSSAIIQSRMTQLYDYSGQLASLCFVIADRCKNLNRERAMLIGLVSHIGAIPILNYASKDPSLSSNKHVVDNALRNLSCITSGLVLTQWGFDPDAAHICEDCNLRQPFLQEDDINYLDVLLAAQLISGSDFSGIDNKLCKYDNHPLHQKFLAHDIIESRASFMLDAEEDLQKTRQLLN